MQSHSLVSHIYYYVNFLDATIQKILRSPELRGVWQVRSLSRGKRTRKGRGMRRGHEGNPERLQQQQSGRRAAAAAVELRCKIRLLENSHDDPHIPRTLAFGRQLQDAGCDRLAVHCRVRTAKFDGAADVAGAGRRIVQHLHIPVILNGADICSLADVRQVLEHTGCAQVMVARNLLANPYLFRDDLSPQPSPQQMAFEYLDFAERHPVADYRYLQLHVRWILREALLQPTANNNNNGEQADFDPSKWQHRLWNFLLRPYLVTYEQWRDIVRLYSYLSAAEAAAAAQPQEDGENGRTLDSNDEAIVNRL